MKKYLFYLLSLLTLVACSKDFEGATPEQSSVMDFDPTVSFLKLQDDSTNIAGTVDIEASGDVTIQWDVLPECNLDTTVSMQKLSTGKYRLPIKWLNKSDEGTYGPASSAFSAWVKIIDKNNIKNIPLIWADEVDSVEIMKQIERHALVTRSGEGESREAVSVTILGEQPFLLDKDTCGKIPFIFKGTLCSTNKAKFVQDNNNLGYHLDLTGVPDTYFSSNATQMINLAWDAQGPPDYDYLGFLTLTPLGGANKYVYFQWKVPGTNTWEFISADPANNATIPAGGTTATISVKTDYAWWINYEGTKTEYPAGTLGTKTGTLTIPANPTNASRTVTYTVGYGTTTAQTITYTQPANSGNTLVYQNTNTLPAGNIPATKSVYTFDFEGGYTGQLRVRSVNAATGQVLFNGPLGTTHSPKVSVPANTSTLNREIRFQYKLLTGASTDWTNLPANTNRTQEGTGYGITAGTISPLSDLPDEGGSCYCTFTGVSDLLILGAFRNGREVARSATSTITPAGVTVEVVVPEIGEDPNGYVTFGFSTDGGATWIDIEGSRYQKHDWVRVDPEFVRSLPAKNAIVKFVVYGTSKTEVVIYGLEGTTKLARVSGYPSVEGTVLYLRFPDNPGPYIRSVCYGWSVNNGVSWSTSSSFPQAAE